MPFLGVQPTDTFASVAKQTLTGDLLGTTSFTLDHGVSSANDIALFINNVRQEPVTAYTASGNTLTLTESINAADDAYLIYIARTFQSLSIKGITDDTQDAIMTIDGSLTTGGDVVLKVGQNQENGYYVQDKDFGFEISNGGVGGNTVQIKNNGQTILSHNQIQDNLRLRTDSTDRITILSGGNVGIGESSPQAKLDVSSGTTAVQATYNGQIKTGVYSTDGNLDSGIEWQVRGDGSGYGFRAINIHAGGGNQWRLQSRDNSSTWTDNITVDGGNVGIGVTDPDEALEVVGSIKQSGTSPYPIKVDSTSFVYYPHYNTAHVAWYKRAVHPSNSNEYQYYWRTSDNGTSGGANETTWMTLNTGSTHGGKLYLTGGVSFAANFASAHTLDDYEEGTWTPTVYAANGTLLTSGTDYVLQSTPTFTKIGNMVHCVVRIRDLRGANRDSLRFTLPFTSSMHDYVAGVLIGDNQSYGAGAIFLNQSVQAQMRENASSLEWKFGSFTYRAY